MNQLIKGASWFLAGCIGMESGQGISEARNVMEDQVGITVRHGQLFGLTAREGISRQFLDAGEQVLAIEAKGITGFVQTNTRLLGFSGRLQRWASVTLSTSEDILKWSVTPRMVVVQGKQATFGFQSDQARWKREPWGADESLLNTVVKDSIAIMITDRRALGFSASTGGFFTRDLPLGNQVHAIHVSDNVAILELSTSTLVFRSGLAIWAELR